MAVLAGGTTELRAMRIIAFVTGFTIVSRDSELLGFLALVR